MNASHANTDAASATNLSVTLGELVGALAAEGFAAEIQGDAATLIRRIGPLDTQEPNTLSFLSNPKYRSQLADTQAACVIIGPSVQADATGLRSAIVTPDPYRFFAAVTRFWAARVRPRPASGIHPSAVVSPEAVIGLGVHIGPLAVIEAGAVIGDGVVIGSHTSVGERARVGAGTRLASHVTIGFDCVIGERCIFHSGVVIGADGFGFVPNAKGEYEKMPQVGNVIFEDRVEVGANTTIDRGSLRDTVIGEGTKIDNQVQIGHNVTIGRHCLLAAQIGLAASRMIGDNVALGADNVEGERRV